MRTLFVSLIAIGMTFTSFAQPALLDLMESVEANNPALKARRELTNSQIVGSKVGNSLANPTIGYSKTWNGGSDEILISQPLDLPMSYIYRNRAARAKAVMYGYEYEAYRHTLLLSVQTLYIEIVALKDMIELNRHKANYAATTFDLVSKRLENGDATKVEYNSAMLDNTNAKGNVAIQQAALSTLLSQLKSLNGGVYVEVSGGTLVDMALNVGTLPPLEDMQSLYRAMSPDILRVLSSIDVAKYDVKVSRSASLPKLGVGYNYSWYRPHRNGASQSGIALSISIPMLGNKNNVKRAKAQQLYAEAEFATIVMQHDIALEGMYARAEILKVMLSEYGDSQMHLEVHVNSGELLMKSLELGELSLSDYVSEYGIILETSGDYIALLKDYLLVCAQIRSVEL